MGFFARSGISGGRFETFEYTDIDRTIAAGLVFAGKLWGRSDDTLGIASIINGISREHAQFLNDGGLGITVGDGMLPHPGNERILETYYNEDRGPVSVISTRLHAQF